jgi:predicted MFS family arabinose efflux permease
MTLILSIHPLAQLGAILLAFYAAYLGFQRTRSLHFGKSVKFLRKRHVIAGSIALVSMLGGIAAGFIMVNRYLLNPNLVLHEVVAMIMLPFGLFGIFSGFFLYLNPKQRKFLPAIHAINNLIILVLALAQIATGSMAYLRYVLRL